MIDKIKNQGHNDIELLGILLGLLVGTGRHQHLANYIREYLASLITQPETLQCWDTSAARIEERASIK